jgi:predicted GIY-YIG superfamily endonuclease
MKRYYIYALEDPRTEKVRYIGMTTNPAKRLTQHLRDRSNPLKRRWLSELLDDGEYPTLRILRSSKHKEIALRIEARLIQRTQANEGWLVNIMSANKPLSARETKLPKLPPQLPPKPLAYYMPQEDHAFET